MMQSGNAKLLVKQPKKFIPGLPHKKYFVVESPFLFVIYEHRSDIIAFIGRVFDPSP